MTQCQKSLLLLALFLSMAHAAHFSKKVNEWDINCPTWHINRFKNVQFYFTIGVKGASHFGFDYEVPISRRETDILHCALDEDTYSAKSFCQNHVRFGHQRPFLGYGDFSPDPSLNNLFSNLEEQFQAYYLYTLNWLALERPIALNEGHVLEYLSRLYLQEMAHLFPKDHYFITGGVTYYKFKGGHTKGELDIVVYDPKTCDVVAIGESKASNKNNMSSALNKAHKQLRRIADFINLYFPVTTRTPAHIEGKVTDRLSTPMTFYERPY